ncbi:hypothetical protein DOY81_009199, partial [Sarcophaga bullata]
LIKFKTEIFAFFFFDFFLLFCFFKNIRTS